MNTHTPGPWVCERVVPRHSADGCWVVYPVGDEGIICTVDETDTREPQAEANAALLAAAPTMLALLYGVREQLTGELAEMVELFLKDLES